jgi:glycosyltransferase involved in cell wall biosynthesis
MYHGNLAATIARWLLDKRRPVVWNVRASFYGFGGMPLNTAAAVRVGAVLSTQASTIVYNSELSSHQHEASGYSPLRRIVIPNGFDTDIFRPSDVAKRTARKELGINADTPIVGLIGRLHPMKDHENFIRAAAKLARKGRDVQFILVGQGLEESNAAVVDMLTKHNMRARVLLLGERQNIPELTAALDVACSASGWGEGFSNTIGEAMACGVPCVVTDVGDSRRIVGDAGMVVPPKDAEALGDAIGRMLDAGPEYRAAIGRAARERVQRLFSLESVAFKYETLYRSLEAGLDTEVRE